MYYPQIQNNTNTRSMIDAWRGYNHNYRIQNGEFYDMENLTSDGYPVMMPRKIRSVLMSAKYEITGMLYSGGVLAYLDGYIFHYSTWSIDLTKLVIGQEVEIDDTTEPPNEPIDKTIWEDQTLLRFGSYILIYPLNIWVDVDKKATERKAGTMGAKIATEADVTIRYSMCDIDGADVPIKFVGIEEPSNPQTGDYWLNTLPESEGLNMYYNSSWNPVATTYVKIEVPGVEYEKYFSVGDAVNMNNNIIEVGDVKHDCLLDLNNGSILKKIGEMYDEIGNRTGSYIVVLGILDRAEPYTQVTNINWLYTLERTIPKFDYVCVNENRVWGCRYGYNTEDLHTLVNEIYCSKLGDFKNYNVYQGLATDAYAVSVGEPGAWTGCISYQGYPTFFKENMVYKMYGSYPSEFSLFKTECRGVQEGSAKSLCIVGEQLFYKAPTGIMAYDGSTPVLVSANLGRETYYFDGVAGASGDKYYIEVTNDKMTHYLFVYDTQYGIWTKENSMSVKCFANTRDGVLFAATQKYIYGLGRVSDEIYANKIKSDADEDAFYTDKLLADEEFVRWYATTGDMGYEYPDYKYVDKITIRAFVPHKSEIKVQISYDDRDFEDVDTLRGFSETKTQSIDITPYRCDHFKIKFIGHGDVRIYSMALTLDTGSEEYEYNKN